MLARPIYSSLYTLKRFWIRLGNQAQSPIEAQPHNKSGVGLQMT
jgi:hypothetical protein